MKYFKNITLATLLSVVIFSCCSGNKSSIQLALNSITEDDLRKNISTLASDEFLGRGPASLGEERTINFLQDQFKQMGLKPGHGNSYFQEVPLVKITTETGVKAQIKGKDKSIDLNFAKDFVIGTTRIVNNTSIQNSEMVFAGYGIVAPEYNWNDYADLNVKGKTVVVLINDPGFATGDKALFEGKTMTYYGRWTYKFEEAARQGATGLLIIHETEPAAYPWAVVENSWTGTRFYIQTPDKNMSNCEFNGWITSETAQKMFELAGMDYKTLSNSACKRDFKPVNLPLKFSASFKSKTDYIKSKNVIAVLTGSERPDEYIVYSAHWDHFGSKHVAQGDSIWNGALDNGTGVGGLLSLAKAFSNLPASPKRSVVFISVTCEESGLLGSDYYVHNPIFPLNKTVADINMDGLNIWGKMKDITIVGYRDSELDDYAEEIIKENGRYVVPDPTPEKGSYFRSDHFSFAKAGVPSLSFAKGIDNIEHGKRWTLDETEKWIKENYHKPSDEYNAATWKFDGMIDDLKIIFEVGYKLCSIDKFPNWVSNSPYRVKRDQMMK
jgi:Zn-dependent M28 family amino/carboxypeptidase